MPDVNGFAPICYPIKVGLLDAVVARFCRDKDRDFVMVVDERGHVAGKALVSRDLGCIEAAQEACTQFAKLG